MRTIWDGLSWHVSVVWDAFYCHILRPLRQVCLCRRGHLLPRLDVGIAAEEDWAKDHRWTLCRRCGAFFHTRRIAEVPVWERHVGRWDPWNARSFREDIDSIPLSLHRERTIMPPAGEGFDVLEPDGTVWQREVTIAVPVSRLCLHLWGPLRLLFGRLAKEREKAKWFCPPPPGSDEETEVYAFLGEVPRLLGPDEEEKGK